MLALAVTPRRPLLVAQLDAMHRSRGGDWYYRTFAPGSALASSPGLYVVSLDQSHRHKKEVVTAADVLVLNGVCDPDLLPLILRRKQARQVTVFEISDDVSAVSSENPMYAFFAAEENLRLFRRLAQTCDGVQYSVPALERVYGYLNSHGRVFRNQLTTVPPLPALSALSLNAPVSVGWGGSNGHFEDIAKVASPLSKFVLDHPNVTLRLMCSEPIWRLFDSLPKGRKQRTLPGSIEQYCHWVSKLDIGIAPLNDSGFNRSRSDVKFLEYASFGVVPVVQAIGPYLESVKHDENGVVFSSPEELVAQLTRLVNSPIDRLRLRANCHAYVARERSLRDHVGARMAFYGELMQAAGAPIPERHADEDFAKFCAWEGVERHGRYAVLGHTRFENLLHDGLQRTQQPAGLAGGVALLRAAAKVEPSHFLPRLITGCQLQSEPDLLAALQAEPRSLQALLALGSVYLSRGDAKLALSRFMEAAELAPSFERPYAHAAQAIAQLGSMKESAEFARIARQLASSVAPPGPTALVAAEPTERPALPPLAQGLHEQAFNPVYGPVGLPETVQPARSNVLDVSHFYSGKAGGTPLLPRTLGRRH